MNEDNEKDKEDHEGLPIEICPVRSVLPHREKVPL